MTRLASALIGFLLGMGSTLAVVRHPGPLAPLFSDGTETLAPAPAPVASPPLVSPMPSVAVPCDCAAGGDDAGGPLVADANPFARPPSLASPATEGPPPVPASVAPAAPPPAPFVPVPAPHGGEPSVQELRRRSLRLPLEGLDPRLLHDSYEENRGFLRQHQALDILAPRGTPVVAVEDGRIARLFLSQAGGITIYQFDGREEYCYYYAHLERYAPGLKEGDAVRKGQVIGNVGTSGNAPKGTPHLHFAIFKLTEARRWWEGTPVNPYQVLK